MKTSRSGTVHGYVRVSRIAGRSGASFQSPDQQRAAIEGWAKSRGLAVDRWHEDLDRSGGSMRGRPEFDRMLADLAPGDTLVVAKLDRFGRTLVGALQGLEALKARDVDFASADGTYDTGTPAGQLALNVMLSFAQFELERISAAWETSAASAVKRGVHVVRSEVYGYVRGPDGLLAVATPAAAAAVRDAFRRRAAGESHAAIAERLNAAAPAREDGHPWAASSVERLLKRDVYLGVARWGEREVHRGAHEALVDLATWRAAQGRRTSGGAGNRSPNGQARLLGGVVRCAGCGFVMSASKQTDRAGAGGRVRTYYRCRGSRASGRCGAPAAVEAGAVERWANAHVEHLFDWTRQPRSPYATSTLVAEPSSAEREAATAELERARAGLADLQRDTAARERLGAHWFGFAAALVDAVRAAERAVAACAGSAEGWEGLAGDMWGSLDVAGRHEVLSATGAVVVVRAARQRGRYAEPVAGRAAFVWDSDEHPWPASNRRSAPAPYGATDSPAPSPAALGRFMEALALAVAALPELVPMFDANGDAIEDEHGNVIECVPVPGTRMHEGLRVRPAP